MGLLTVLLHLISMAQILILCDWSWWGLLIPVHVISKGMCVVACLWVWTPFDVSPMFWPWLKALDTLKSRSVLLLCDILVCWYTCEQGVATHICLLPAGCPADWSWVLHWIPSTHNLVSRMIRSWTPSWDPSGMMILLDMWFGQEDVWLTCPCRIRVYCNDPACGSSYMRVADDFHLLYRHNRCVIEGHLCKKNWKLGHASQAHSMLTCWGGRESAWAGWEADPDMYLMFLCGWYFCEKQSSDTHKQARHGTWTCFCSDWPINKTHMTVNSSQNKQQTSNAQHVCGVQ